MKRTSSSATIGKSNNVQAILTMVAQIPRGHVATYGQIARLAGIPRNSRQVGTVLKTLPHNSGVPWYRVVNSKGEISQRGKAVFESCQRETLEAEGVKFDVRGRICLKEFGWSC